MRAKRFLLEALVVGMSVHPLGALIAWACWPGVPGPLRSGGWSAYFGLSIIALVPLLAFAGLAALLEGPSRTRPGLRFALLSGRVAFPLSALYAQVESCRWAHTDAQGALMFVFGPFFCAAYAVALVVALGLARTMLSLLPRWR